MEPNVGEGGEVISLTRHWREVAREARKALGPSELISDKEAMDMARQQIRTQFGDKALVEFRGGGKAYFDNNGSFLQPVQVYETQVIGDDAAVPTHYLCVIPLWHNSPEPLKLIELDPKAKERLTTVRPATTVPPPNRTND